MMRGLYIICEGPTEEEFINSCLAPYLAEQGIYDVRAILLTTSKGHRGGALSYGRFKDNIERLLKQENDILLTSLIDFFRLHTDFPLYFEAQNITDKLNKVAHLEEAIKVDILNHRFIPYIQLHEFEGLLFSDVTGFNNLPGLPAKSLTELTQAVNEHQNPELLNDGALTAPSKRLQRLIPGYQKVLQGSYLALDITLPVIMQRCVRFSAWVETLVTRMKQG